MTPMCAVKTCLLRALQGEQFCCLHLGAVLARDVHADHSPCGRCRHTIHRDEFVSRTMAKRQHKTTKSTIFEWQHAFCQRPVKEPTAAARRKAPKPLLADL
jgi:cytidine deaminase